MFKKRFCKHSLQLPKIWRIGWAVNLVLCSAMSPLYQAVTCQAMATREVNRKGTYRFKAILEILEQLKFDCERNAEDQNSIPHPTPATRGGGWGGWLIYSFRRHFHQRNCTVLWVSGPQTRLIQTTVRSSHLKIHTGHPL